MPCVDLVSIDPVNCMLPDGTKPLLEPMLTELIVPSAVQNHALWWKYMHQILQYEFIY